MIDLVALIALGLAGLPVSALIFRSCNAIYFAPVLSATYALIAGLIHLVLDLPIWVVWLLLVGLSTSLVLSVSSLRSSMGTSLRDALGSSKNRYSLVAFALFQVVSWITTPAPLIWDARSIWFHHASWLNGPALYYREAQFLPAGAWPDYPIAGPANMALSWQLTFTDENLWLASRVMGMLFVAASFLAGSLIIERANPKLFTVGHIVYLVLFASSAALIGNGWFNTGYQDSFQAVTVLLLFTILISMQQTNQLRLSIAAAVVFLLAANIKQEGFWFATGVLALGLFVVVVRRLFWPLLLLAWAAFVRLVWGAISEDLGMPENSHTAEVLDRLPQLFDFDSAAWISINQIWIEAIQPRSLLLVLAVIAAALSILLVREWRPAEKLALATAWALAPIGVLLVAVVTYALGESHDLSWWLGTSYTRITATFDLLAFGLMLFAGAALSPWQDRPKRQQAAKPVSKKAKKRAR